MHACMHTVRVVFFGGGPPKVVLSFLVAPANPRTRRLVRALTEVHVYNLNEAFARRPVTHAIECPVSAILWQFGVLCVRIW